MANRRKAGKVVKEGFLTKSPPPEKALAVSCVEGGLADVSHISMFMLNPCSMRVYLLVV